MPTPIDQMIVVWTVAAAFILDQNPLEADAMKIRSINVSEKIKKGKTIYKVDNLFKP